MQLEKDFEPSDLSTDAARKLGPDQRWTLYTFWCKDLRNNLLMKTADLQVKYKIS